MRSLKRFYPYLLSLFLFFLISCQSGIPYDRIPIPDRRMNLSGLMSVSTHYLNEHPGDFYKFNRILTAADESLGLHDFMTRAGVMKWIHRMILEEGYDEEMPVYLFLRTVYLEGWEGSYLNRIDLSEREYLYDLISAVMGGMHLCATCSTRHESDSIKGWKMESGEE
jgi:hypothetical protein